MSSNAEVPEKSEELKKVEVPSEKVLAAKDKKKEQAARLSSKKPSGASEGSRPPTQGKRPGGGVPSRSRKRSKLADGTLVIDLDTAESVPHPTPLWSIPPKDALSAGEGGVVLLRMLRLVCDGNSFFFKFHFLLLFVFCKTV